jgi:hypothetical protein
MSVSPILSATSVLGAGNVLNPLILHLSGASASESEYEPTVKRIAGASRQPVIVNGKLLLNPKRIYKCTFDSCDKSYAKPSRLEEHERSHTGDVGQIDHTHFPIVTLINFAISARTFAPRARSHIFAKLICKLTYAPTCPSLTDPLSAKSPTATSDSGRPSTSERIKTSYTLAKNHSRCGLSICSSWHEITVV